MLPIFVIEYRLGRLFSPCLLPFLLFNPPLPPLYSIPHDSLSCHLWFFFFSFFGMFLVLLGHWPVDTHFLIYRISSHLDSWATFVFADPSVISPPHLLSSLDPHFSGLLLHSIMCLDNPVLLVLWSVSDSRFWNFQVSFWSPVFSLSCCVFVHPFDITFPLGDVFDDTRCCYRARPLGHRTLKGLWHVSGYRKYQHFSRDAEPRESHIRSRQWCLSR